LLGEEYLIGDRFNGWLQQKIEKQQDIHINVKTAKILRTRVFSVLLYATETWTLTQENEPGHIAGIRNAMLLKITKLPMAAENNTNVEDTE
jgi:hypothetical protein